MLYIPKYTCVPWVEKWHTMPVLPGSELACVGFEQWVPVGYGENQSYSTHLQVWYAKRKKGRLDTSRICY
jgi:hypothetical protein